MLGYLPQEFGYYPGYTPRQFLRYVAALQCIPGKEADRRISELLILDEPTAGQIVMLRDHRLFCCDSPAGICGKMKGRVFEVLAETALEGEQFLLSERQGERGTVLRIFCDTPPQGGCPGDARSGGCVPGHLPGGAGMRLLRYEWGKLVRLPALWGFLALCLAFNCLLIGSGDRWRWEWNETAVRRGGHDGHL